MTDVTTSVDARGGRSTRLRRLIRPASGSPTASTSRVMPASHSASLPAAHLPPDHDFTRRRATLRVGAHARSDPTVRGDGTRAAHRADTAYIRPRSDDQA